MMEAQTSLRMIEEVDPKDTAKLDEIEARVWCWLNRYEFASVKWDRVFIIDDNQCEIEKLNGVCTLKYTRSRDALKDIESPKWRIEDISYIDGGLVSLGYRRAPYTNKSEYVHSPFLPTWELAQAHCIIQAIEYDRTNHTREDQ